MRIKMLCVLSVVLLLVGCSPTPEPQSQPTVAQIVTTVSVTGKLVPAAWASVATQTGGTVVEVLVQEGDLVSQGDVLIRLDPVDAEIAVQQAEAALALAEAQLARLEAGVRAEELAVAEVQVLAAQAVISQTIAQRDQIASGLETELAAARAQVAAAQAEQLAARQRYDETLRCFDAAMPDGSTKQVCPGLGAAEEQARYALNAANIALAAAEAQLDAIPAARRAQTRVATAAIDVARVQRDVARAQLELLKAGPAPADVAVARASVAQAQAVLEAARVALRRTEIRAPLTGTVGSLSIRSGEVAAPGAPLLTIGDLATLRVETTDLDEIDVARVDTGRQVVVTFDALPDRTFSGRITRISSMPTPGTAGVNYTLIVELDDLAPQLRWGMTAFVEIDLG